MAHIKKIQEEKAGDWQIVFCSLSIILVAFFVMLCSYATMEEGKLIEVSRSFQGAIQLLPSGILLEKGDRIILPSADKTGGGQSEEVALLIFQFLREKGLQEQINLRSNEDAVILTLMDAVIFAEDSAELLPAGKSFLKDIAPVLRAFTLPMRIEGHTDDRPVQSEKYHSNLELSALRAVNVLKFLNEAGNIPAARLSAAGYGPHRPFLPNKTEDERRRNRRVEIVIPVKGSEFEDKGAIRFRRPPSFKLWDLSL